MGTYLEIVVNEHIRRLKVTMRDPDAVKIVDGLDDLTEDVPCNVF